MAQVTAWLENTARRLPDKVAVSSPNGELTFARLEAAAKAAGTWIADRMEPRCGVALYLEKSPLALACMLGAAYAGCFYSVLDVRQPNVRLASTLDALEANVLLTDANNLEAARELVAGRKVELALIEDVIITAADADVLASRAATATDIDPLYVNFTSGSTGTPKGVVVAHRSVADFIPVFVRTFGITEDDIIANQAPFDFDVSVKDIYSSLFTGATLCLVPRPFFSEPAKLMDYLAESRATVLVWAVSAMCFVSIMGGLKYRVPTDVRLVMFSGEVMPPKQLRRWQEALGHATFVNLYGPTEITCNCTYHVLDRTYENDEVIPMGKPFANERVVVVDEDGALVNKPGKVGELLVSGTTLALGYLGNAERTAEAFVQHPLNGRWLERAYRTGDLVRYDETGDLVYVGRADFQIKHMGQRIELGDIEAAAQAVSGVERACCIYDARKKKLKLFYQGTCEKDALIEGLHGRLASYMVPNACAQLSELPLTKNGKIDRTALAAL